MWGEMLLNTGGQSVYLFVVCCFLLFGLFGCCFFAVWAGACFFFAVWAGARAPPNQQKKTRLRAQTAKKQTRPRPFRACFLLLFGRVTCAFFFFLLFGRGCGGGGGGGRSFFFFLLFGRCACFFFVVWAGVACLCFCCLAGGRFCFLLFGRGTGVHSLTGLPGSSSSDPTTKKTKQQKKKTRVPNIIRGTL